MFEFDKHNNRMVLKRNTGFMGMGIVALIMAAMGIRFITEILPFEEGYTAGDVFGLIFLCVWEMIVLAMGVYAFITNSKEITLGDDGVLCKTWFTKQFFSWAEIADWGLSYCGQTRGVGNTYDLYFAKEVQRTKNSCGKKLKGKMIKCFVMGTDYHEALAKVIPFCKERTSVEPFIGEDKYHFM